MPLPRVVSIEDWTRGDPLESPNAALLADMRRMTREIIRLRNIERAAEQIIQHHGAGNIKPVSPLACQAVVDLGHALLHVPQWRRT